jgi:hypothetical protein
MACDGSGKCEDKAYEARNAVASITGREGICNEVSQAIVERVKREAIASLEADIKKLSTPGKCDDATIVPAGTVHKQWVAPPRRQIRARGSRGAFPDAGSRKGPHPPDRGTILLSATNASQAVHTFRLHVRHSRPACV